MFVLFRGLTFKPLEYEILLVRDSNSVIENAVFTEHHICCFEYGWIIIHFSSYCAQLNHRKVHQDNTLFISVMT